MRKNLHWMQNTLSDRLPSLGNAAGYVRDIGPNLVWRLETEEYRKENDTQ
jgi:hypothetical protein